MKNDHGKESRAKFLGQPTKRPSEKGWNFAAGLALSLLAVFLALQFLLHLDAFGPAVVHPTPVELLVSLPPR